MDVDRKIRKFWKKKRVKEEKRTVKKKVRYHALRFRFGIQFFGTKMYREYLDTKGIEFVTDKFFVMYLRGLTMGMSGKFGFG